MLTKMVLNVYFPSKVLYVWQNVLKICQIEQHDSVHFLECFQFFVETFVYFGQILTQNGPTYASNFFICLDFFFETSLD